MRYRGCSPLMCSAVQVQQQKALELSFRCPSPPARTGQLPSYMQMQEDKIISFHSFAARIPFEQGQNRASFVQRQVRVAI